MNYGTMLIKRCDYLYEVHWYNEKSHEEVMSEYQADKVVFGIVTNDRGQWLYYRVKCLVAELKDLVEHHNVTLAKLEGDEAYNATYEMCVELQNSQIEKIGRVVRRFLTYKDSHEECPYEVTDELALQCYDLYAKEVAVNDQKQYLEVTLNEEARRRHHYHENNPWC